MKKILLIGNGTWGKNYVNTISNFNEVNLDIADRNNWQRKVENKPDGVIISTPPDSRVEIVKFVLDKDIPILAEKPFCFSVDDILSIQNTKTPILVNYIQLFTRGHEELKNNIDPNKITSIITNGYSNGPVRNYSSLWDYGPHDLSIVLDLYESAPRDAVIKKIEKGTRSLFQIDLSFGTSTSTSLVGNGGYLPARNTLVICDGVISSYDDKNRPDNHVPPLIKVIQTFLSSIDGKLDYRIGLDMTIQITKILQLFR